jgi:cytochrome c oxidase assembly protein subunit 11
MNDAQRQANAKLIRRLLFVVVGMFGFGFAMVPLYDVFCDITGLNGKTGTVEASAYDGKVDTSRTVTVEFIASLNESMPWEFAPVIRRMQVHPGQVYEASYRARNVNSIAMTGQAIPSVTPSVAALHFKKTECFCFTQQHFEAGEELEMPLRFVVDPDLPKDISTVTLAYTFFDVTGQMAVNEQ